VKAVCQVTWVESSNNVEHTQAFHSNVVLAMEYDDANLKVQKEQKKNRYKIPKRQHGPLYVPGHCELTEKVTCCKLAVVRRALVERKTVVQDNLLVV